MKILVVSQYFWPENIFINDMVSALSDKGHHVVVATGKPNYPEGKVFDGYKSTGTQEEIFHDNVTIIRVPLRPRGKSGAINLFLNYLSFVWSGSIWFPSLLKKYQFDSILIFAGSPNVAIPGVLLKKHKKAHIAIWVQDLWPESLSATGFIHNKLILNLVGMVVKWTYSRADTILVQSRAFIKPVSRYAKLEKIVYFPNTVKVNPSSKNVEVHQELLDILKSNFCIVFAGNIGTAQSMETIIEAALNLKDNPFIKIVLIGSGSMLEWVNSEIIRLSLDNLITAGRFPVTSMPLIFEQSCGLLVTLKNEEIFSYTIPSKIQAYLGSGKPIIAALNGEGAQLILEAGAGIVCPAEDGEALALCIKELYNLPEEGRIQMGKAGKHYFHENFEVDKQAIRLIEILEYRIQKEL